MKNKRLLLVFIAVFFCLMSTIVVPRSLALVDRFSRLGACPDSTYLPPDFVTQPIAAEEVVVRPWKGRHHVYGLFLLPEGTRNSPFFAVNIEGDRVYCSPVFILPHAIEGLPIKPGPGERLAIGFLRTRLSLWLFSKGKGDELNQPENWSLVVGKES